MSCRADSLDLLGQGGVPNGTGKGKTQSPDRDKQKAGFGEFRTSVCAPATLPNIGSGRPQFNKTHRKTKGWGASKGYEQQ